MVVVHLRNRSRELLKRGYRERLFGQDRLITDGAFQPSFRYERDHRLTEGTPPQTVSATPPLCGRRSNYGIHDLKRLAATNSVNCAGRNRGIEDFNKHQRSFCRVAESDRTF